MIERLEQNRNRNEQDELLSEEEVTAAAPRTAKTVRTSELPPWDPARILAGMGRRASNDDIELARATSLADLRDAIGADMLGRSRGAPGSKRRRDAGQDDAARTGDIARARVALRGIAVGGGASLPASIAARHSALLGVDLSDVRIHDHGDAHAAAAELRVQAYASGVDIAFARGAYDPDSPRGQHVLAHELVHVAQQKRAGGEIAVAAKATVGSSDSPIEAEAERGAAAVLAGQSFEVANHGSLPTVSFLNDGEDAGTPAPNPNAPDGGAPLPGGVPDAGGGLPPGGVPADPNASAPPNGPGTPTPAPNPNGGNGGGNTPAPAPAPNAGGGNPPAPAPDAGGGTPAANPLAPGADGYTAGANFENKLDGKINDMLNERADPVTKAFFEKNLGGIDALRLASQQYKYTPASFWRSFGQSLCPTDDFVEHARQGFSQNAYTSSDGFIAKIQVGIEALRGVIKILGDVAATIGGIASLVGLIATGVALFTANPIVAIVAAIATAIAEAASIVKILTDLIDTVLSVVQIVLLVIRARTTDDPGERARIAQLLKKEAGDIAKNVLSMTLEVGMLVAGNLAGSAGKSMKNEIMAIAKGGTKALKSAVKAGLVKRFTKDGLAGVARNARRQAIARGAPKARLAAAEAKLGFAVTVKNAPDCELILGLRPGILQKAATATEKSFRKTIYAPIVKKIKDAKTYVKAAKSTTSSGKKEAGRGGINAGHEDGGHGAEKPNRGNVIMGTVGYWPAILEQMNNTRDRLQDANNRMKEQYDLARGELDEAKGAEVDKVLGKVKQSGSRILTESKAKKEASDAAKAKADEGAGKAGEKKSDQEKAKAKSDDLQNKAKQAQQKTDEAVHAKPKANEGIIDKIKNYTIGKVAGWLSEAQTWLAGIILKGALWAAGINGDDCELAGMERHLVEEGKKDDATSKESGEAGEKAKGLDPAVFKLMDGAKGAEQRAIQGVVDAMAFIDELDGADQYLGGEIEDGAAYIEEAAPIIEAEIAVREKARDEAGLPDEEKTAKIDDAYLAPIAAGIENFKSIMDTRPSTLNVNGMAAVMFVSGQIKQAAPDIDLGPAQATWNEGVTLHVQQLTKLVADHKGYVDAHWEGMQALKGSTSFDSITRMAVDLEGRMNGFYTEEADIVKSLNSQLQEGVDAFAEAINSAYDEPVVPAPGVPGPQNGAPGTGGNGNNGGNGPTGPVGPGGSTGSNSGGTPDGGTPDGGTPDGGTPSDSSSDSSGGTGDPADAGAPLPGGTGS